MSKLDSPESHESPAAPKSPQTGKSAAASRILRAVEMGRTQQNTAPGTGTPQPAPPTTTPAAGISEPTVAEPAQESLRSLSAATQSQDTNAETKISATKAGVAAAKQAAAKQTAAHTTPAEDTSPESPVAQAVRARAEAKSKKEDKSKADNPVAEVPFAGAPGAAPGFWAKLSLAARIGIVVAVLAVVAGGAYFLSQDGAAKSKALVPARPQFVPMNGAEGWNNKWAGDAGKQSGRSISAFRPSQTLANYRIEFEGQIESKALGWVFRAQDPKNYYAYKLEVIKPGLEQVIALSRIAVVNGIEAQRHYTPLKAAVRPGHTFRVRMDAKGSEFATYIGGELVEVWQDERLRTGAVGLLQDKDERAQLHKVQIFEMR